MNIFLIFFTIIFFSLSFWFSYNVRNFKVRIPFLASQNKDATTAPIIIARPIIFDAQRKLLTALYRERHTGDCDHRRDGIDKCVQINPELIVLHMTDINSFEDSFLQINEPVLSENRKDLSSLSSDKLNVSAHYLVDVDGTIYNLMPENYMARHAMGLNHISIAIENVGKQPTDAQIDADISLVTDIKKRYNIKNVISHSEVEALKTAKSSFYVEKNNSYFREKPCGAELIKKIRGRILNHES